MSIYNDYCNESMKEFEKKTGVEMTPDHQNLYRLAYNEAANTWHNIGKKEGWNNHIEELQYAMKTISTKQRG